MADPMLIPPPSIGASQPPVTENKPPKIKAGGRGSRLWILVLGCVVVGVSLGVLVYQQSVAPSKSPTPRPSPRASAVASPSPTTPSVSQVTPQSNTITMPKAGQVRVYYSGFDVSNPSLVGNVIRLTTSNGSSEVRVNSAVKSGELMHVLDTGITVTAGQQVTIEILEDGLETTKASGWIKPDATNKCGAASKADGAPFVTFATQKSAGEPLVAVQCWGDYDPPGDTGGDYNDYLAIVSYVPPGTASPSPTVTASATPTPTPTVKPSVTPTPTVKASATPTPTPTPTLKPSATPTPTASTKASVSPSPSASARVAMPEASSLPDAGIFEVTAGTVGIGALLMIVGLLGLLLI